MKRISYGMVPLVALLLSPLQHARATYIATDLGSLGMPSIRTSAFAINDTGQIVGKSVTTTGVTHAFLWSNGGRRWRHPSTTSRRLAYRR